MERRLAMSEVIIVGRDQKAEYRAMWPREERPHSIAHWLRRSWRFDALSFSPMIIRAGKR
jgi:hypothetical protein